MRPPAVLTPAALSSPCTFTSAAKAAAPSGPVASVAVLPVATLAARKARPSAAFSRPSTRTRPLALKG